jgi:serine protease
VTTTILEGFLKMKKVNVRTSILATVVIGVLASSSAIAAQKAPVRQAHAPRVDAGASDQSYGRFIVTYRDGTATKNNRTAITRNMGAALTRAGLAGKAKPATASYMRKLGIGADLVKTSRKLDAFEAEAFMRQIKTDPAVLSVVPDRMRRAVRDVKAPARVQAQAFTPNDTYFGEDQWNFKAPDGTVTQHGAANKGGTNVDSAWELADGTGIVIAVLDTGITAHPDVDTSLADAGYDFITDSFVSGRDTDGRVAGGWDIGDWTDEEPYLSECTDASNPPSESSWHGTHVASTAGAELTNNAMGEAGIAYGAKILPVRVLGHCGGYDSDINDAIIWAAGGHIDGVPDNANPAQVINLSLGGSGACSATDPAALAIAQANELGATVVVSAGNSGADAGNYSPASCPGAVTVASTGITSKRAYYSNYGATVEIAAPGGGVFANDGSSGSQAYDGFIWQALNPGAHEPTPSDEVDPALAYGGYAGTSQAAPHVSGIVALMQGARIDAGLPAFTPAEVLATLQSTAYAPSVPPTQPIGAGIVDAAAAVAAAIEPPCTEDCGPVATPLTNKVEVKGLSGAAASEKLYSFEAQAGAVLSFMTYGGTGNVSVYVSFDAEPTTSDFDAKSTRAGNSETVRFTAPQAGTYYIKLVGAAAYSGVTLVARQ